MLDADRQALSSVLYHQSLGGETAGAAECDGIFAQHRHDRRAALRFGVALFFEGFVWGEGFVDMPLILQFIYYTSAATCIGSEMYCIASSTFCTVFAPPLALNGPRGSVHVAVAGMYEERGGIWKMMALGMFLYVAMIAKRGSCCGRVSASSCSGFVTCLFIAIGVVILSEPLVGVFAGPTRSPLVA